MRLSWSSRRGLTLIALATWCIGGWLFWTDHVPLRPNRTVRIEPNPAVTRWMLPFGSTADGLVVVGFHQIGSGRARNTGPVQLWNPKTGTLVRELFDAETDVFLRQQKASCLEPISAVLIRKDGTFKVVDLMSGKPL